MERRGGSWSAGERESLDRWRFWNEKLSKEDVYRNTSTLWLVKADANIGSHTPNDDGNEGDSKAIKLYTIGDLRWLWSAMSTTEKKREIT